MYGKKNGNKKFSRVFNIESLYVPSEVSLIKCRKLKIVAGTCEKKCWKELKFSLLFWPEILLDLKTQPIDSCARFFALTEFEPAQVFRVIHWKFSLVCPTHTEKFEVNSLPRSVSTWRLLVGVCTRFDIALSVSMLFKSVYLPWSRKRRKDVLKSPRWGLFFSAFLCRR